MTTFNDPSNADNFRMTVDWGRWYVDNLPGCDIAPATEDRWPSCSTVKKAADKDWSFLTVNRIAALPPDELHRIADLDHTQRSDAVRSHEKFAKNVAFGRGTIIHLWAEDLLGGLPPREISDLWLATANGGRGYPAAARDEALVYLPALIDFFDVYQPEPVATEYVTIHRTLNGHGYGATPDCLARIEGAIAALDWKTRGPGSSHAAYAEEAAQIACGARAEYMVVRRGEVAVRQPIPDAAGGYVVSIKPDGARLYPIDIDKAWAHWCHLHEWWTHKLDEKASIGRVKPNRSKIAATADSASEAVVQPSPGGTPPPGDSSRREALLKRYNALSEADREAFDARKPEGADLDVVELLIEAFERPPSMLDQAQQRMADDAKRDQTRCRSCGAAILWATTEKGKQMPLDPDLRADGNVHLDVDGVAHVLDSDSEMREQLQPLYVSHFATCPNAAQHRTDAPAVDGTDEVLTTLAAFLNDEQRQWVGALTSAPISVGRAFRYSYAKTARNADVCIALAKFAGSPHWDPKHDEGLRAAIYVASGSELALQPGASVPELLAQLDAGQAAELKNTVDAIAEDLMVLDIDDDGSARWTSRPA